MKPCIIIRGRATSKRMQQNIDSMSTDELRRDVNLPLVQIGLTSRVCRGLSYDGGPGNGLGKVSRPRFRGWAHKIGMTPQPLSDVQWDISLKRWVHQVPTPTS